MFINTWLLEAMAQDIFQHTHTHTHGLRLKRLSPPAPWQQLWLQCVQRTFDVRVDEGLCKARRSVTVLVSSHHALGVRSLAGWSTPRQEAGVGARAWGQIPAPPPNPPARRTEGGNMIQLPSAVKEAGMFAGRKPNKLEGKFHRHTTIPACRSSSNAQY